MLGLRPWEFPLYTLREYQLLLEGFEKREERERWRNAELAAWLLAPWTGKGKHITPGTLLGKR